MTQLRSVTFCHFLVQTQTDVDTPTIVSKSP